MKRFIFSLLILIFTSCGVSQFQEFQREGEAIAKKLIALLQKIETKEDMEKHSSKIRLQIERLTDLMIQAKKFQMNHRGGVDDPIISVEITHALRDEIKRIYQIPHVEEAMHDLERDSLHKLDAFDRHISYRKLKPHFR
ncbi:MAG: hypothetical protein K9M07_04600 [Simkaniaceae bacterium]|nr:hypothetical protein [Simkaniaceae bacterium]MCF7852503.1 hypothetical protein [Simkaniaceae bacterium]